MKKTTIILIIFFSLFAHKAMAARSFTSGFELNSLATGVEFSVTSGTAAISTTNVRSGTYAGRVNAGQGFFKRLIYNANLNQLGFSSVAVYIVAYPNNTGRILSIDNVSSTLVAQISMTSTGNLLLFNAASTQIGSASSVLALNTWYTVELKNEATTNPGVLTGRYKKDGDNDWIYFASGANSAQGGWGSARIGLPNGTQTTNDIYFDDWKINGVGTDIMNQASWPGDGKVIFLSPNAAGDANAWLNTSNGAGASTDWGLVDELPPNDATDFINSVTLNAEDLFNVTNSGIGTNDAVNVVQIGGRFNNNTADATTAFKLEVEKTSGGTISQSATAIIPNSTAWLTSSTTAASTITLYADPDGNPWKVGTLDSMQIGAKLTAAGTNKIQLSALWAYVDYSPGPIEKARKIRLHGARLTGVRLQ